MDQLLGLASAVSLRLRLLGAGAVVVVCAAFIGWVAFTKVDEMDVIVRNLAANDLRGVSAVKEANINLAFVTTAVVQAGAARDASEAEYQGSAISSYAELIDAQMVRADSAVHDSTGRARLAEITAQLPALKAGAAEVVSLAASGKADAARAKATEVSDAATAMASMFAEVAAIGDVAGDSAIAEAERAVQSGQRTLLAAILGGALILLVAGILLAATTLRPIDRAVAVLERVAQGDLSVNAEVVGHDELARMSAALNTAIGAQRDASARIAEAQRVSETAAEHSRAQAEELVRRVDGMLATVDRAAKGDLTVRIGARETDALGRMGTGIDAFLSQMDDSLRQIGEAAIALSSSSREIAAGSERLGASAEETAGQAESVSEAAESVTESVSQVVTEAGAVSAQTLQVHAQSHNATEAASEAVTQVHSAQQVLQQLTTRGQQVGKVVGDISTIARQTNLLALNAAVEAARAGESGAGFAIVAAEVRNLAIQSATASQEIEGRIAAIQQDAIAAAAAMGAVATAIGRVDQMNAGIVSAAGAQKEAAERMRGSLDRAAAAATEIATRIAEVASAAGGSRSDALESATSAEGLADLARELDTLVSRFKRAGGEGANFTGSSDDNDSIPDADAPLLYRAQGHRPRPPQLHRARPFAGAVDGRKHGW